MEPLGFCCQTSPQTPKRCMKYQRLLHSPRKAQSEDFPGSDHSHSCRHRGSPQNLPVLCFNTWSRRCVVPRGCSGSSFPQSRSLRALSPPGRFGAAGFSPPGCDSGGPGPPALGAVTRSAPKKAAGGGGRGAVRARSTLGMRAAPWPARARAVTRGTPCAASTVGAVS